MGKHLQSRSCSLQNNFTLCKLISMDIPAVKFCIIVICIKESSKIMFVKSVMCALYFTVCSFWQQLSLVPTGQLQRAHLYLQRLCCDNVWARPNIMMMKCGHSPQLHIWFCQHVFAKMPTFHRREENVSLSQRKEGERRYWEKEKQSARALAWYLLGTRHKMDTKLEKRDQWAQVRGRDWGVCWVGEREREIHWNTYIVTSFWWCHIGFHLFSGNILCNNDLFRNMLHVSTVMTDPYFWTRFRQSGSLTTRNDKLTQDWFCLIGIILNV